MCHCDGNIADPRNRVRCCLGGWLDIFDIFSPFRSGAGGQERSVCTCVKWSHLSIWRVFPQFYGLFSLQYWTFSLQNVVFLESRSKRTNGEFAVPRPNCSQDAYKRGPKRSSSVCRRGCSTTRRDSEVWKPPDPTSVLPPPWSPSVPFTRLKL